MHEFVDENASVCLADGWGAEIRAPDCGREVRYIKRSYGIVFAAYIVGVGADS